MLREPRRIARAAILSLCIGMGACGFWKLALAQEVVGLITGVGGSAQLIRGPQSLTIGVGMGVDLGDKIVTAPNAHLTLTLRDGSTLNLAESGTLRIDHVVGSAAAGPSVIGLLGGHLGSVIAAALGGTNGSYEVHTPNAIAGVRGTKFETAFVDGIPCPGFPTCLRYTEVGVSEGLVEVSNPTNPNAAPVIVKAGYETTVPCQEPPSSPGPLGIGEMGGPGYH